MKPSPKFTAEDVIAVYKYRKMFNEFLSHLKPVTLLDKFDKVPPMLHRDIKFEIKVKE